MTTQSLDLRAGWLVKSCSVVVAVVVVMVTGSVACCQFEDATLKGLGT